MYKKCKGCEKNNILIFSWLAGDNFCNECKKDLWNVGIKLKEKASLEDNNFKNKNIDLKNNKKDGIDWNDSKNIIIVFLIVVIILFLIAIRSSHNEDSYDKAIKNSILKSSNNKMIDCTGINKNSPTCMYLENLPTDESGPSQVYP